ncbi:MAG: hypothetical protein WD768_17265 [Phycisphaeraceae bacterium]
MTQRDKIVGGALIAVILVCGVFVISHLFGGPPAVEENPDLGFKCQVCGEEFVIKAETLRNQPRDTEVLEKNPNRTSDQAHCPKCQAKHAGLTMLQCPQCKKWFLLSDTNVRTHPDVKTNTVCPHCGLDLMEQKRKQR